MRRLTAGVGGAKVASSASADAELTGKLTIAGDSLARVIAAVGAAAADNPLLAHKFSLKARVAASAAAAGINDITFELGGVQGTGAVSVLLADGLRIDAAIALNHVDLDQLLAAAGTATPGTAALGEDSAAPGPAEPFALPQGVYATLDLRVNALVFNQAVVRQAQLVAALDQGVLTLQQASALLPGSSDVTIFGVLDAQDGKPRFTGQVEASAARWRDMVDAGQRRVVGLNCYQSDEESPSNIFKVDPEVERVAIERIEALRAGRDAARHEKAMAAFARAARDFAAKGLGELGDCALTEAAIEAARAEASTGEMMGVLKETLGWRPPHEY